MTRSERDPRGAWCRRTVDERSLNLGSTDDRDKCREVRVSLGPCQRSKLDPFPPGSNRRRAVCSVGVGKDMRAMLPCQATDLTSCARRRPVTDQTLEKVPHLLATKLSQLALWSAQVRKDASSGKSAEDRLAFADARGSARLCLPQNRAELPSKRPSSGDGDQRSDQLASEGLAHAGQRHVHIRATGCRLERVAPATARAPQV